MNKLVLLAIPFVLSATACGKSTENRPAPAAESGHVQIAVTEKGFEPDNVAVSAGQPITLVFTRKTDKTCAKEVVVTIDDATKVEKPLPLDTPVEIAATFPKAGTLSYACGMDMLKGSIVVR